MLNRFSIISYQALQRAILLRGEATAAMSIHHSLMLHFGQQFAALKRPGPQLQEQNKVVVRSRVLSICDYEPLLNAREQVLHREGYDVVSVSRLESIRTLDIASFRFVIICQSISQDKAAQISCMLKACNPHLLLLRMNSSDTYRDENEQFDAELDGSGGPTALLEALKTHSKRIG